jgi:hypothetical protein
MPSGGWRNKRMKMESQNVGAALHAASSSAIAGTESGSHFLSA